MTSVRAAEDFRIYRFQKIYSAIDKFARKRNVPVNFIFQGKWEAGDGQVHIPETLLARTVIARSKRAARAVAGSGASGEGAAAGVRGLVKTWGRGVG